MRTKNPTYLDKMGNFVARIPQADGSVRRYKQKVPESLRTQAEKVQWARTMARNLRAERSRALTDEYLEKLRCPWPRGCTIGEIIAAAEDERNLVNKRREQQVRMVSSLRRVLAFAMDLWTVQRTRRKGVKIGARVPDSVKIDALPATVLNAETVRRYFCARLGVQRINWLELYENAVSVNATLHYARLIFMGKMRAVKLVDLELPDVSGFMRLSLKEDAGKPEPLTAEEFEKVVAHFDALKETRPELWRVNLVIRQTGLRSLSSAMQVHRSWLRRLKDGAWLSVTGKTSYTIPVSEELAREIERCEGPLFPEAARAALLREHTERLKALVGAGSGGQVNHRLRDTVASACWSWLGLEAAQEALGHKSPLQTLNAYASRMDVSEAMKRELQAWPRVLPQNVVRLQGAA